jgi:hypothetical protein
MDAEDLDLTIIEATDDYRPGHENGTRNVGSHGVETSSGNDTLAPPSGDTDRSSLESRIAQLEADVESWQRRTVMWRERALSAQALNEALNQNLDDLRTVVRALAAGTTHAPEVEVADVPASQYPARQITSATVVAWCNKVFRRDFVNRLR